MYTVFIRIVATATCTITFSLAWVWLLIEGGSYSRAALINFGLILYGVIHKNRSTKDWFTKTSLQVIEIRSSKKLPRCGRIKPRLSSAMVWLRMSEQVPLAVMTTPTELSSRMRAATIRGWLLFRVPLLYE